MYIYIYKLNEEFNLINLKLHIKSPKPLENIEVEQNKKAELYKYLA